MQISRPNELQFDVRIFIGVCDGANSKGHEQCDSLNAGRFDVCNRKSWPLIERIYNMRYSEYRSICSLFWQAIFVDSFIFICNLVGSALFVCLSSSTIFEQRKTNFLQNFFFIHRKPIHLRLFLSGTQSKLYVRMEEHIVAGEGPSSYGATEKCATINLLLWRPLWVVWVFVQSSQTKKLSIEEMFPCMC